MTQIILFRRGSVSFQLTSILLAFVVLATSTLTGCQGRGVIHCARENSGVYNLPSPTRLLALSYEGVMNHAPTLKGMRFDPEKPLHIEFIIDTANQKDVTKEEARRLIRYFLAGLTLPQDELWVNLSPYEKDRVATDNLCLTDLGKDMLGQDYALKQLVSSLTYPESETGKVYWNKIYDRVGAERHVGPINTYNKVWVMPKKSVVYENKNTAFILEASLKVMHERDYLAERKNASRDTLHASRGNIYNDAFNETILPEVTQEVNEGKNFATLRQIYHSLILAVWFRKKFKNSFYKHYIDKGKISGIDLEDKGAKDKIYNLYVEAYKKGVYNYIKRDRDLATNKSINRRYYSGGHRFDDKAFSNMRIVSEGNLPGDKQVVADICDDAVSIGIDATLDKKEDSQPEITTFHAGVSPPMSDDSKHPDKKFRRIVETILFLIMVGLIYIDFHLFRGVGDYLKYRERQEANQEKITQPYNPHPKNEEAESKEKQKKVKLALLRHNIRRAAREYEVSKREDELVEEYDKEVLALNELDDISFEDYLELAENYLSSITDEQKKAKILSRCFEGIDEWLDNSDLDDNEEKILMMISEHISDGVLSDSISFMYYVHKLRIISKMRDNQKYWNMLRELYDIDPDLIDAENEKAMQQLLWRSGGDSNVSCGTMDNHGEMNRQLEDGFEELRKALPYEVEGDLTEAQADEALGLLGYLRAGENLQYWRTQIRNEIKKAGRDIPDNIPIFFSKPKNGKELFYDSQGKYSAGHFSADENHKRIHVSLPFARIRGLGMDGAAGVAAHEWGHIARGVHENIPDKLQSSLNEARRADRVYRAATASTRREFLSRTTQAIALGIGVTGSGLLPQPVQADNSAQAQVDDSRLQAMKNGIIRETRRYLRMSPEEIRLRLKQVGSREALAGRMALETVNRLALKVSKVDFDKALALRAEFDAMVPGVFNTIKSELEKYYPNYNPGSKRDRIIKRFNALGITIEEEIPFAARQELAAFVQDLEQIRREAPHLIKIAGIYKLCLTPASGFFSEYEPARCKDGVISYGYPYVKGLKDRVPVFKRSTPREGSRFVFIHEWAHGLLDNLPWGARDEWMNILNAPDFRPIDDDTFMRVPLTVDHLGLVDTVAFYFMYKEHFKEMAAKDSSWAKQYAFFEKLFNNAAAFSSDKDLIYERAKTAFNSRSERHNFTDNERYAFEARVNRLFNEIYKIHLWEKDSGELGEPDEYDMYHRSRSPRPYPHWVVGEKSRRLKALGFTHKEVKALMDYGVVGNSDLDKKASTGLSGIGERIDSFLPEWMKSRGVLRNRIEDLLEEHSNLFPADWFILMQRFGLLDIYKELYADKEEFRNDQYMADLIFQRLHYDVSVISFFQNAVGDKDINKVLSVGTGKWLENLGMRLALPHISKGLGVEVKAEIREGVQRNISKFAEAVGQDTQTYQVRSGDGRYMMDSGFIEGEGLEDVGMNLERFDLVTWVHPDPRLWMPRGDRYNFHGLYSFFKSCESRMAENGIFLGVLDQIFWESARTNKRYKYILDMMTIAGFQKEESAGTLYGQFGFDGPMSIQRWHQYAEQNKDYIFVGDIDAVRKMLRMLGNLEKIVAKTKWDDVAFKVFLKLDEQGSNIILKAMLEVDPERCDLGEIVKSNFDGSLKQDSRLGKALSGASKKVSSSREYDENDSQFGGIDARRRAFNIETRGEGISAGGPMTVGAGGQFIDPDFDTLDFTITYMADLPAATFLDELAQKAWR